MANIVVTACTVVMAGLLEQDLQDPEMVFNHEEVYSVALFMQDRLERDLDRSSKMAIWEMELCQGTGVHCFQR